MTIKKNFEMKTETHRFIESDGRLLVQPLNREPKRYRGQDRLEGHLCITDSLASDLLRVLKQVLNEE